MKYLPTEIWSEIFTYLHQNDQLRCMLVCSRWKLTMEQCALYHTVSIYSKAGFQSLINKIKQDPGIGNKIERLVFFSGSVDANLILPLLHNLRELFCHDIANSNIVLTRNGSFHKHIECVSEPRSSSLTRGLLSSGLCPKLNSLKVWKSGLNAPIIPLLKNAPALKHLELGDNELSFVDLEVIHKNVPGLISLKLNGFTTRAINLDRVVTEPATSMKEFAFNLLYSNDDSPQEILFEYIYRKYPNLSTFLYYNNPIGHWPEPEDLDDQEHWPEPEDLDDQEHWPEPEDLDDPEHWPEDLDDQEEHLPEPEDLDDQLEHWPEHMDDQEEHWPEPEDLDDQLEHWPEHMDDQAEHWPDPEDLDDQLEHWPEHMDDQAEFWPEDLEELHLEEWPHLEDVVDLEWTTCLKKLGPRLKKLGPFHADFPSNTFQVLDDYGAQLDYISLLDFTTPALESLAKSNQSLSLQSLELKNIEILSFDWLKDLQKLEKLKVISLSEANISLLDITSNCPPTLTSLSLVHGNLTISHQNPYTTPPSSIKTLYISNMLIINEAGPCMAHALPKLNDLTIRFCLSKKLILNLPSIRLSVLRLCIHKFSFPKYHVIVTTSKERRSYSVKPQGYDVENSNDWSFPSLLWTPEQSGAEPHFTLACHSINNIFIV